MRHVSCLVAPIFVVIGGAKQMELAARPIVSAVLLLFWWWRSIVGEYLAQCSWDNCASILILYDGGVSVCLMIILTGFRHHSRIDMFCSGPVWYNFPENLSSDVGANPTVLKRVSVYSHTHFCVCRVNTSYVMFILFFDRELLNPFPSTIGE